MKIDIMRSILMKIDSLESGIIDPNINLNEFSNEELSVYLTELANEGFVEFTGATDVNKVFNNKKLTTEGRNFIRVARNQVLWRNAKKTINLSKNGLNSEDSYADLHEMKFHFISLSN